MNYLDEIRGRGQEANPFFCLMGIKPIEFGEGKARLAMDVRDDMKNGEGWLQGGIFTAIGDEAIALAIYTLLSEGETIATVSCTTNFIRGIQNGTIHADGIVIRKGRQMIYAEASITNAKDESLLARCYASFIVRTSPGT
ncbi:PaaI family thioesterase [Methanospirillum stamsii]|uniref:Phenylacetic acid degradation protein n=1 Tax=Methanospirillum stamsii TaxID=1277351 RepID=A0A2V2N506_9EURY|nr:PaaI family thioesterase [Methanospirillum stamsii]PWR75162.1 phenylacetic acid degradation protein [Methanospirillum stamsii]